MFRLFLAIWGYLSDVTEGYTFLELLDRNDKVFNGLELLIFLKVLFGLYVMLIWCFLLLVIRLEALVTVD